MGAIGLITPPIVGAHITVGTDEEEEEEAIRPFSLSHLFVRVTTDDVH